MPANVQSFPATVGCRQCHDLQYQVQELTAKLRAANDMRAVAEGKLKILSQAVQDAIAHLDKLSGAECPER